MSGNGRTSIEAQPAGEPTAAPPPPSQPEPKFEIASAASVERAATPTLRFTARVEDPSNREVYAAALTTTIEIEPARRVYDAETRERLAELFGEAGTAGGAATTRNLRWARVEALVPGFSGSGEFAITVPCSRDLELAATKYFQGLADGRVPLRFHFNGQVFYLGDADRLQIVAVPWECSTRYELPIAIWDEMIEQHHSHGAFLVLGDDTLERLRSRRAARGLPSFDACIDELLEIAGDEEG